VYLPRIAWSRVSIAAVLEVLTAPIKNCLILFYLYLFLILELVLNHGKGKVYKQVMRIGTWEIHVTRIDNEQLAAASPEVLAAENGKGKTAKQVLKDLSSSSSGWKAELLDTAAEIVDVEVNN